MYYQIKTPEYKISYRLLQTLRYKGNNINFCNHVNEIKAGVNYFNQEVKKEAHKNPKIIYAIDIFENCIAIFLNTDKIQDSPAKGLQLFSSYFTKNNTVIGKSEKNDKLFVKVEDPVILPTIKSYYDVSNVISDVLLNPAHAEKTAYESLKRDELSEKITDYLIKGFAVKRGGSL